jgi:cation transport regulator ChaB
MPADEKDLPSTLERSPDKVQRTYEKTLDSAEEQYDSEQRAHRTAWAAVKHIAEKKGDHWELKGDGDKKGPSDPQAERGGAPARDRPRETFGGVDANKPKKELERDAREAGIEVRSRMTKKDIAQELQRHNDRETARSRNE